MSLQPVGLHAITLEPANIQEMLELSRNHDQQLKEARQDLLRAETNLHAEQKWKWVWRAVGLCLGALGLVALQNTTFQQKARQASDGALTYAEGFAPGVIVVGNVSMPVFVLMLVGLAAVAAAILLAFLIVRKPPPRRAVLRLMERFVLHDSVTAQVFGGDSAADVAAAVAMRARPRRMFSKTHAAAIVTSSLASSMVSILHHAAEARPILHLRPIPTARAPDRLAAAT
jgi:hypothetical protein